MPLSVEPLRSSAGGDLTGTYPNPTLVTTGVTGGAHYGSSTQVPSLTVDSRDESRQPPTSPSVESLQEDRLAGI